MLVGLAAGMAREARISQPQVPSNEYALLSASRPVAVVAVIAFAAVLTAREVVPGAPRSVDTVAEMMAVVEAEVPAALPALMFE